LMSYVVLARKYRPRRFEQMVGQDHVVRALTHALEQGRLHHAYLFTGTRGIGKTTVSRILAKSLNCTGPDGQGGITAHPCGACTACTEIDGDRFIDYIELDAASNRSIDEIRDLIERAAYKPSVGRYKVFMIDEAHQLTKDAFNALLKTLEEPPDYLKFVLATTDPEKMLPTVLSRCLQFNLRPMAPETVAAHLAQVLAAEGIAKDLVRVVQQARRQAGLLQQPADRNGISGRKQRTQGEAPGKRNGITENEPDAETIQYRGHQHADGRQSQHGPLLRPQAVHIDMQAAGEQHERQQPIQEHARQVGRNDQLLPPLPQFHDIDRAVDQDNDDGKDQRSGHHTYGSRQMHVKVVHDPQDGRQ